MFQAAAIAHQICRAIKLGTKGNAMRKIMLVAATAVMLAAPEAFAQATNQTSTGQTPRAAQPNSGAGVPGLPGGKSGAAVSPSGTAQSEPRTSVPDQSGIHGLPGTESGPTVQPPFAGQPRLGAFLPPRQLLGVSV